jgi:hypothetical protein
MSASVPNPMHAEWTRRDWERVVPLANKLGAESIRTALEALRTLFPPEFVGVLPFGGHPLVAQQVTYPGRLRLLELGHAIARVGIDATDIARLRDPSEYESTAAELRAALMFERAGAVLERPPLVRGAKRCEYIGVADGWRFAIEAKLPDISDEERDTLVVETQLLRELMGRLDWLGATLGGVRATFHFAPTILTLGNRFGPSPEVFDRAIDAALLALRAAASRGSLLGTTELGAIGTLAIRKEPMLERIQFDGFSPSIEPGLFMRRLRRNLNYAIQQITAAGLPGIIVLDTDRQTLARNALGLLARWAEGKAPLAALLLVDRDSGVDVLPGRRFAEAEGLLAEALELCDDGHLHYDPLSHLVTPCPLIAWR